MSRQVDGWPTMDFKGIDEEKQIAFWRSDGGAKDFRFAYADALAREEVERQRGYVDKQFRPVEYWIRLGYDGDRIKNNALPHQIDNSDPMVGTQYQVAARGQIDEHEIAQKRSQILQTLMKKRAIKEKVKVANDGGPEADEGDSPSNSDDGVKPGCGKNDKQEQKRKAALKKRQEEEERDKKRKREHDKEAAQAAKKAISAETVRMKQEAARLKEVNKGRERAAARSIELATKTQARL